MTVCKLSGTRLVGCIRECRRIRFCHMGHTITVRIDEELADWLADTARRTGRSQGEIVREQLQRARSEKKRGRFMRLAGCVDGARDLSSRKGFSKG